MCVILSISYKVSVYTGIIPCPYVVHMELSFLADFLEHFHYLCTHTYVEQVVAIIIPC
jgi:hypothetical protein